MIRLLINMIVRNQLNKIDAYNEEQFYNRVCNRFNNGKEFIKINEMIKNKKH